MQSKQLLEQNIEFGNAGDMDTQETGCLSDSATGPRGHQATSATCLLTNLLLGYASSGSLIRQAIQTANSSR
ncbi:hypothetical protein LJR175_006122 [Variovorax sp. LjRoot175]|uniref:hypothetical protein n=1 Tax=Variovorax sp. LjRoot175 TaxID=3342276 RepID=UPI003ECF48AB